MLKTELYRWCPIQVRNNVLVQLVEVISLEVTSTKPFFTHKLMPRTLSTTRNHRLTTLVGSIGLAHTSDKRSSYVVLGGDDVGENSGTKTTLVTNREKIKHIANVMSRKIGSHLTVNKLRIRVGHEGARSTIVDRY